MSERWKPEYGEVYYFITRDFKCSKAHWCIAAFADTSRYKTGNCFRTEAKAQSAAEKVKALLLSLHDNGETLQDSIQDKQLPDWCKVGEYVFDSQYGYGIVANSSATYCNVKFCDFSAEYHPDLFSELKQARLRPWTPEEAIGKVVYVSKCYYLITSADEFMAKAGAEFIRLDKLAERYFQPDSSPCGKLEHLENGEWVE